MRVGSFTAPLLFLLFSIILVSPAVAYSDSTSVPMLDLFHWKLRIDTRYSLVQGEPLTLSGGSVGYAWGRFEREVSIGYHWSGATGSRQLNAIEKQNAIEKGASTYPRSDVSFVNIGYWHILKNSKRWKWGVPLEIGVGKVTSQTYTLQDELFSQAAPVKQTIIPAHLSGYMVWKANRWVGIGLQGGYRFNLRPAPQINTLQGPFCRIRFLVYPAAFRDGFNFVFKGKPLPSPFFKKE